MKFLIYFFCLFASLPAFTQNEETPPNYKHEVVLGGGLHSQGYMIGGTYSRFYKPNRSFLGQAQFAYIKHPKERRMDNDNNISVSNSGQSRYTFGKQNSLYSLRLGAGQRFFLSERNNRQSLALSFSYTAGVNLGLLKPYYLDLIYRTVNDGVIIRSEPYSEENRYKFLDPLDINGASSSALGWDELQGRTGLYLQGALYFDFGPNDEVAKALEIGVSADYFFQEMPIMLEQPDERLFVNIFLHLYLGKRW
ncbi:hypothetical protein PPO43_11420 [Saprospira sp. CCB-QB6]|uniref:hypothetical protein n=1 Tax=Saprospira sp. CCB-QB6 TaxID=3023936 RepID=UPI00234B5BC5|nr:hypothetical protein [Saprospira sp. CCB-QB6]WCL80577.1 hypothetical protein PPO43_11420 [Saprospira sp. CCB-QB6]